MQRNSPRTSAPVAGTIATTVIGAIGRAMATATATTRRALTTVAVTDMVGRTMVAAMVMVVQASHSASAAAAAGNKRPAEMRLFFLDEAPLTRRAQLPPVFSPKIPLP